ncbi:tetratricopeptide repeat protein [Dokdonia ponticola]|uniref:Tetratricopeptide repeat protein n=1 Tax=Dokdonia ponticola TaxID=2041041 RepID=A0ABV9I3A4_9FLAO
MNYNPEEEENISLTRFESMLKTNNVMFFDSEEFESITNYYIEEGKIALARKAVKLGLEQHPTSVNLKLYRAEIFIFENKFDEANAILNELYELEPTNEEVYIQKANIYSKQDEHKKAINLLEIAIDLTEEPADVYSLIGMEYLFIDDFQNAKYNFMKCLEIDETDYSALYNIIYCFDFLEQREEAIDYLNMFLNKNPYCEVAWHQVGKQYFDLKQYEKALSAFDFAVISDDRFIGAYLEKGKVLEKLGRYNEALENYQITLELDDPTSFALLRMGKCYDKLGNDELALKHYKRCVHEDPLLDNGWIAITDYYSKRLDFQKALYYINKAIHIDAENVLYWKRYAKINHRLKFYEEAENGYRKTLELGNYELETWLTHADILLYLEEIDAAITILTQALEFYPENAEVMFRLSGLNYNKRDDIQGRFFLKTALMIDADFSIILEELFPYAYSKKEVKELLAKYNN